VSGLAYNLISDIMVTVNALFTYLDDGLCLRDEYDEPLFVCWSHPGSYLSAISVRMADGATLTVRAGTARQGFASVILNGHEILQGNKSSTVGELSVLYTDLRTVSILNAGLYNLTLQNSDEFINVMHLQVSSMTMLKEVVQSHGLIGQTWRAAVKGEEVREVEGRVDDYAVDGGLTGCVFAYSKMQC
jgi:hypothetical protein